MKKRWLYGLLAAGAALLLSVSGVSAQEQTVSQAAVETIAANAAAACTLTVRDSDYYEYQPGCITQAGTWMVTAPKSLMVEISFISQDGRADQSFVVNGLPSCHQEGDPDQEQEVEFDHLWIGPDGDNFHISTAEPLDIVVYAYNTNGDLEPVTVTFTRTGP